MSKKITVSPTKAYRVEGLLIKGEKYVSVRQLYATKKDPEFKIGRQGITFALTDLARIQKALSSTAAGDSFKELNLE